MKDFLEKWKRFAVKLANFQIKLLLCIIYFVLILPYRLGFAIKNILTKKISASPKGWIDIEKKNNSLDSLRRQF